MKNSIYFSLICSLLILSAWSLINNGKTILWKLNSIEMVGGYQPVVLGNPKIKIESTETSVYFNGVDDGLILPVIPIESWTQFTIEVKFKPAGDGPIAPRFIHFEDTLFDRGTIELRLTPDGQWYLDAFLRNGKTGKGLTLIDSTKLHPTDKWYWAAMVYDGKKISSYVNGQKELEGAFDMPPFTAGKISLGVRLNKVNWFKGQISEVRFHPEVLNSDKLQRTK